MLMPKIHSHSLVSAKKSAQHILESWSTSVVNRSACMTCSKTGEQHALPANHDYWNAMVRQRGNNIYIILCIRTHSR